MRSLFFPLLVALCVLYSLAKPVEVVQKLLVMNDRDKIIGTTYHKFQFDHSKVTVPKPPLPEYPANTDKALKEALRVAFPVGSPNITVTDPWTKKAETCQWSTDSNLIHHFEDTVYVPLNDICSLSSGLYTWIVTADYEMSFGQYSNAHEFATKHANLALMRTGYVAGEIAVIDATAHSKAQISWNLLSGTYSIPISENDDPDNPMAYLENVLYPKMQSVLDTTLPCARLMHYGEENEFFPDVLPSGEDITTMCTNNYFIMNEDALTWKSNPNKGLSVCNGWDAASTCSSRA